MNKEVDINRLNYESYVIDYLDGKLNAVETACLIAFLENNPDIKEEISDLDGVTLVSDDNTFEEKAGLKKKPIFSVNDINEENYEEFFVANYEGDLGTEHQATLKDFIKKNPELNEEFEIHGNLKIQPSSMVFSKKDSLKHKSYIGLSWYSSIAAAILLFLASWFFINNQEQNMLDDFASLSQLDSRNSSNLLSLNSKKTIEVEKRELTIVHQSEIVQPLDNQVPIDDTELLTNRVIISVSPIDSKIISEQIVDSYIYSRIIVQPENITEVTPEVFDTELAIADPPSDDNSNGLMARIFNKQISKFAQGVKSNRTKRPESTDPTYVKVIDRGLLVFNTLTGSETATVKTYNQEGELTGYQIEGREVMLNKNFASRTSSP
ncbi:MAG: hypothetical protein QM503_02305 [Bacteroidota bacterium]